MWETCVGTGLGWIVLPPSLLVDLSRKCVICVSAYLIITGSVTKRGIIYLGDGI